MNRAMVEIEPRRAMGPGRRRRIHEMREGKCWFCGKPVEVTGPTVRYDHRLPLELGGSDDDANVWPLHREPCDRIKTASDMARIAKAKRRQARDNGTRRERKPIPSRGFADRTRKFDGSIGPTRKALRQAANDETSQPGTPEGVKPNSPRPTGEETDD